MAEKTYSQHPVDIMTEALESAGLKPDPETFASIREYMDEPIDWIVPARKLDIKCEQIFGNPKNVIPS